MEFKIGNRIWVNGDFAEITKGKVYRIDDLDDKYALVVNDSGKPTKIPLEFIDNKPSIRDERFSFFEIAPNAAEKWGVRIKMDGLLHIGCRHYMPAPYLKMCQHLLKNRSSRYHCDVNNLTFIGTEAGLDDRGEVIPWKDVERIIKNLVKSKIKFDSKTRDKEN